MQTVLIDFQERVEEINRYFAFLEKLEQETLQLSVLKDDGQRENIPLDSQLIKTLKANSFLLLYNLVESSMRNAVTAIFDELKNKKVSYNSVRIEIKKIVIQNFKKRSPDKIHSKIKDISTDIIAAGFKSQELFSGNIDRDEISKTAKNFGFSFDTEYNKTKHGESLYMIMNKRNDLAHGNKSFAEIGKDITVEELLKIKEEVTAYLEQILNNINQYITGQDYLDKSQINDR
ncbi:hypothetical protein MiTe_00476 [Microcystis aeruginosa NIES-2520]|jgi:hypothetical protein|uniref:MAE-28990/MAE-18760-like HEPN domain-containing protein n=1 Tax=Microcystis aeruginosa NIES-2520 TaxID=2303982 RepID=A0A5A5RF01_MICAE|nr:MULTISPECIES: MAE_28990/MAE_18760 family HEPN-like nuclease [Microcystis]MCA2665740.1 hypothetical protein [Microcystis sp. M045S2]MCA2714745.1 hypothetical protein [Microcystis sp. M172S2]MCA2803777.1 hypothetical protein [Microcystis sp. M114S2]MCA2832494.1 hypothetical protein [Microcystis sp. M007S1]MCA2837732.1 hypothetical protein [Microcystis sp. M078S1]